MAVSDDRGVNLRVLQFIPDCDDIAPIDRISENIRQRHRHFRDLIHIIENRHISYAGQRVVQKMRIDLVAVGEDLHLLPPDLLFVEEDLSLPDLPDHFLVLIEHMVKALRDYAYIVLSPDRKAVVRMRDGVVNKLCDFVDRRRHMIIGVKDQDPQKYDRHHVQRPHCPLQALLQSPVLRGRNGKFYLDPPLPVAAADDDVRILFQLCHRRLVPYIPRLYKRELRYVSVTEKNSRRITAEYIAQRPVQRPVVKSKNAHSDRRIAPGRPVIDRIIVIIIEPVLWISVSFRIEIIVRTHIDLFRQKVKVPAEAGRLPQVPVINRKRYDLSFFEMHSLIALLHPVQNNLSRLIRQDFLLRYLILTGHVFQKIFQRKPAKHRRLIAQFLLIKTERVTGLFEQAFAQGLRTGPLHFCYIFLCNYDRCHEHNDDQADDTCQLHQDTALKLSNVFFHIFLSPAGLVRINSLLNSPLPDIERQKHPAFRKSLLIEL